MMPILCPGCQVAFPDVYATVMAKMKSGVVVAETFDSPERIYRLWMADEFKCPGCGHKVVAEFANQPFAEHFQKDFAAKLAAHPPDVYWHEKR